MMDAALNWLAQTTSGHVAITIVLGALVMWALYHEQPTRPQGGA